MLRIKLAHSQYPLIALTLALFSPWHLSFLYSNLTHVAFESILAQRHHWTHPPRFTCAELFVARCPSRNNSAAHIHECSSSSSGRMWCSQVCVSVYCVVKIKRPFLWVSIIISFRKRESATNKNKNTANDIYCAIYEFYSEFVVRWTEWMCLAWTGHDILFFTLFCSFAFEKCDTECDVRFREK